MRHILHADMDAFFASVEQLDNPALRGKPVLVGGSPESRGVVAAASYEARRYGCRSAMPMRTALNLCPEAIRVDPRFHRYSEISGAVMGIFHEITPLVEPLSLDEAYLDVTDQVTPSRSPDSIAREIRARIARELGLTVSVGVATSKSIAKIASDMCKPNGMKVVQPGAERDFLAPLEVRRLWGVGPKTAEKLNSEGVHTIGEMAARSEEWFRKRFGRSGQEMLALAQGRDDRPVITEHERKSFSAETTLVRDTGDIEALIEIVRRLSLRVARDLEHSGLYGKTVKIKLRLADFTTITRQSTLQQPVQSSEEISSAAEALLRAEAHAGRRYRLIGVGVSGFASGSEDPPYQLRLEGF